MKMANKEAIEELKSHGLIWDGLPNLKRAVVHAITILEAQNVGKWIQIENSPKLHKCSNCDTAAEDDGHVGEIITPFCPYCGAYMENASDIILRGD